MVKCAFFQKQKTWNLIKSNFTAVFLPREGNHGFLKSCFDVQSRLLHLKHKASLLHNLWGVGSVLSQTQVSTICGSADQHFPCWLHFKVVSWPLVALKVNFDLFVVQHYPPVSREWWKSGWGKIEERTLYVALLLKAEVLALVCLGTERRHQHEWNLLRSAQAAA